MTANTSITLYGLSCKPDDDKPTFSPFVVITQIDLAILGLDYKIDNRSFTQIRSELSKEVGDPSVTVPTLKEDGKYITDSWDIAEWLDSKHATADRSLFPSADSKSLARFLSLWAFECVSQTILDITRPKVYHHLDADSQLYYARAKFNNDVKNLEELAVRSNDASFASTKWEAVRKSLAYLEATLKFHTSQGREAYFNGERPTHADAIIFGWYAYSRMNKSYREGWEHEDLPELGKWLGNLVKLVGEENLWQGEI